MGVLREWIYHAVVDVHGWTPLDATLKKISHLDDFDGTFGLTRCVGWNGRDDEKTLAVILGDYVSWPLRWRWRPSRCEYDGACSDPQRRIPRMQSSTR